MATDFYGKQRAAVNIGLELRRRGWTLLGFHEDQSDSMTDYYHPASWDGVAIHANYPGAVVGVNVSEHLAKKSGRDETRTTREPGEPCARCGGSGVEPDALSYEEAQARPSEAHRTKHDRAAGLPRMVIAFGSMPVSGGPSVSRSDYHPDGRPRCLACHGRGHAMREVTTTLFTWPTFSATPTGRAWHVEVHGRRIATGTGFAKCDDYGERAQRAAAGVADEIEAAVQRTLRVPTAASSSSADAPAATGQGPLATVATGGGITVRAEHDAAKGWTYLRLEPRVERAQYDAFAERFNVKWHRMRRQPVLYRLVGADELARFFGPLAGEEQPQAAPAAPSTPTPEAPAPAAEPPPVPEPESAPAPAAGLVDEAQYTSFVELFAPSLWGGEEPATQARDTRAAHLERAGWSVTRTITAGDMSRRDALVERTPALKACIPGEFRATRLSQRVSAGAIRVETAPAASHLRYLLVRKGSGESYRNVESGAVDIALRDRYAVLTVLRSLAEALLRTIRSGMAHLSATVYESLEAADADAPNHLIGIAPPVPSAAPSEPEATVEAAPAAEMAPLARILQLRAEVQTLKAQAEAQIAALHAIDNLSFSTLSDALTEARRPWHDADAALHRLEADTLRALNVPLAAEEQYLIRDWGDAAIAKRNRDLRARAYRAAGWAVKTDQTDGAFYLNAANPWYTGAVIQVVQSNGPSSLKRITPETLGAQYVPVRISVPAALAQATPDAPEPTPPNAAAADETPRPLAEPTIAAAEAPAPTLVLPEPVAPVAVPKGKGGQGRGSAGPMQQLSLF